MPRRSRPLSFLRDGGVCPDCGGTILGVGSGPWWLCLTCGQRWGLALHPDADLTRSGFPIRRTI